MTIRLFPNRKTSATLSLMESESRGNASAVDASAQLDQLRRDQRWAKLTGDMPAGEDALVGIFLLAHLLSVGLLVAMSSGQISTPTWLDTDTLFTMAMLDLLLPVIGQIRWQTVQTSSWHGTPESRPSRLELAGFVVSYVLGLCLVITAAAHGWWAVLIGCAVLAGVTWIVVYRHWMTRYRAEFGYRGSRRAYALVPVMVIFTLAFNVGWAALFSLVGRLVPGL